MRLNEMSFEGQTAVEGYGPGFFRAGGARIEGGALVRPEGAAQWGGYDDLAPLLALAGAVDVLFVGTGAEIAYLPADFRTALEGAGLGVEPMSSPAAARTYNVLLGEGRRVAAALLPVGAPAS